MELTTEILDSLSILVLALENLGILGLIALLLFGPTLTVLAIFVLDYFRQRQISKDDDLHSQEAKAERVLIRELVESHRSQTNELVERHRADTDKILRDFGEKHGEVAQYYRDNVELVKITQHLATDMRDIIINNTRALEKLVQVVQLKQPAQ